MRLLLHILRIMLYPVYTLRSWLSDIEMASLRDENMELTKQVKFYNRDHLRFLKRNDYLLQKVYTFPNVKVLMDYTKKRAELNIEIFRHVQYGAMNTMTPTEVTKHERELRSLIGRFEENTLKPMVEASEIIAQEFE